MMPQQASSYLFIFLPVCFQQKWIKKTMLSGTEIDYFPSVASNHQIISFGFRYIQKKFDNKKWLCFTKLSSFLFLSYVLCWGHLRQHCNSWVTVTCWVWPAEACHEQSGQKTPDSLFREPAADVIEVGRARTRRSPPPQRSHTPLPGAASLHWNYQAIELSSSESTNGTPSWLETSLCCGE